jgi:hypothetical protein
MDRALSFARYMVAKMCRRLHHAPRVSGWADSTAFACDGVIFHPATGVYADTVAQVQASLRLPLLRAFVGRGLLEGFEAKEMLAYWHSGFALAGEGSQIGSDWDLVAQPTPDYEVDQRFSW